MDHLDELRELVAKPSTSDAELQKLLADAEEQLSLVDNARKVIHDSGFDNWSFEVFQEAVRVGADSQMGDLTQEEWNGLRRDAKARLHDQALRDLNKSRQTFEAFRLVVRQELARRESGDPAPKPAKAAESKSRRRFWKK